MKSAGKSAELEKVEAAIVDAHAAFIVAVESNAWRAVSKYAEQIADLRAKRAQLDGGIYNFLGPGCFEVAR